MVNLLLYNSVKNIFHILWLRGGVFGLAVLVGIREPDSYCLLLIKEEEIIPVVVLLSTHITVVLNYLSLFHNSMTPLSLFHVLPILPKLPPDGGESDGHQQDDAAGYEVRDGQEVVWTSEPGQRGQHHFLSALEGLYGEVWKGRGQG